MGENQHQAATSSRLGIRNTAGEILEVQGDRIVRSTGRKDRHSKVCTAKGARDRRVRLAAHTAIQFYDVQDRLGYDRPSKAVDWLIKKAKAAIDELAELPPWTPATVAAAKSKATKDAHHQQDQFVLETGGSTTKTVGDVQSLQHQHHEHHQQQLVENPNNENNSSFLPPSLDSDAIADTIKSFFPMGASVETSSAASIQFQNYPPDLLSRTSSQSQDLRLSLQSFQEPILLQHHHGHSGGAGHSHNQSEQQQQVMFSGTGGHNHHHLDFDGASAGWSEQQQHHQAEINRFQRMAAWNAGVAGDSNVGGGGFMFNPQQPPATSSASLLQPFFGQNQFFSQRGPLQSSNTPLVRAWIDPAMAADHNQMPHFHHQSFISSLGFAPSNSGGFSGFRVPARIQGEEEEHDGIHNKPSSASSNSRR